MKNLIQSVILISCIVCLTNNNLYSEKDNKGIFQIDSIKNEVDLNKYWLFHPGDDTLWKSPAYNDAEWDTLQTTINLKDSSDNPFDGLGWFRLHIQIDPSLRDKTYALTIDQQGASEIYLNGDLLKRYGTVGTDNKQERTYNPKLIPCLFHFDDTLDYVLAIRYSNLKAHENFRRYNQEEAGFNITISDLDSAVYRVAFTGRVRSVFITILTVFIFIAFLHLLLYLFYRRLRSNLYFFLFMVAVSMMWMVVLHTITTSSEPGSNVRILYYLRLCVSLSFPFLSIFIYSIFYPKFPRITWLVLGAIPVLMTLIIIHYPWAMKTASLINLLILVDVVRNIIRAILKKNKAAWIIASGFLLFIFFFLIIAVVGLTANKEIITSPGSTMGIIVLSTFLPGIVFIPLSMSIYLAIDFARTNIDLEKQLENVKILSAKTIEQEKEKQRILENQKEKLEVMVAERTEELATEKEKTEKLLLNTLPLKVVNELKANGKSEPESFNNVTVYFSDIVGFTNISSTLDPKTLIHELNEMFTAFDDIMVKNHCERIKTIGDAYLAVSGMPVRDNHHAENMIQAAIEIKRFLKSRNNGNGIKWQARIGIHSGNVVGGIVGVRKYIYDVFGDTINTASRMESHSEPMRINVSAATFEILQGKYNFIERETIQVKGKGPMKMYFLNE